MYVNYVALHGQKLQQDFLATHVIVYDDEGGRKYCQIAAIK